MKLCEMCKGTSYVLRGDDKVEISGIAYDSRNVRPGDLFFCISGFQANGNAFAADAVRRGAAALVSEYVHPELDIPQIVVDNDRRGMARLSAAFYGRPAEQMRMIGITGTNGKTTTTYMLKHIAEQAGCKVGLIGTIRNMIGDEELPADRTTPESPDLHQLLRRMCDSGCDMVVMEVSSHSLALDRTYGITFDIGVFTNLTQDHLDFHQTMDDYLAAKERLFEQSRVSIINVDDAHAHRLKAHATGICRTYGITGSADYSARNIAMNPVSVRYDLEAPMHASSDMRIPIPGRFSVYNSLAASAASMEMGIHISTVSQALSSTPSVDGRFEVLNTRDRGFALILDYAHTPDSLVNTLTTVREFARGRVVTVFGCGGDRDRTKRPAMGRIATELSDLVFVTSDNPRSENPDAIIEDIVDGIPDGASFCKVTDRREAIRMALIGAQPHDVVVLAGKGHETYQEINGVKHDFDEKVVVEQIFNELGW